MCRASCAAGCSRTRSLCTPPTGRVGSRHTHVRCKVAATDYCCRHLTMMPSRLVGSTRFARRVLLLPMVMVVLAVVADAFLVVSPSFTVRTSTTNTRPLLAECRPPPPTSCTTSMASMSSSSTSTCTTTAVRAPTEVALDPIVSDLRSRILGAPTLLEGNEESRLHAEATLSTTFRVDNDGNLLGAFDQQVRLARALALNTFVVGRNSYRYHAGCRSSVDAKYTQLSSDTTGRKNKNI